MRPREIHQMQSTLQALSRCGGISSAIQYGSWLVSVGAVGRGEPDDWLVTDPVWLSHATPARDDLDLLRRTAIGDAMYRFHVDSMVAEVLAAIAAGARWDRLEELLFGALTAFAPRFVQLLEVCRFYSSAEPGTSRAWNDLRQIVEREDSVIFARWDRELWADMPGGGPALFPLLVELYPSLLRIPTCVHENEHALTPAAGDLLSSMVVAGCRGEACLVDSVDQPELQELINLGLPIRKWPPDSLPVDCRHKVGLVGPVRFVSTGTPTTPLEVGAPLSIDKALMQTCRFDRPYRRPSLLNQEAFWAVPVEEVQVIAFPGFDLPSTWPDDPVSCQPGIRVPPARLFLGLKTFQRRTVQTDEALLMLSQHLVFGFLLQLFLLEALDRELNQETISLMLKGGESNVPDVDWLHVFFQPAYAQDGSPQAPQCSAYDLGEFESVLNRVSSALNLRPAGLTYIKDGHGFWSLAVRQFYELGLVEPTASQDRFVLGPELLDRLHGGELMRFVLRRGRDVRDKIRSALQDVWREIDRAALGAGEVHA